MNEKKDYLAKNLRYFRLVNRMTRQMECEKLGVTATSVANWETGIARPSREHVEMLANLYDVDADRLYDTDLCRENGVRLNNDADRVLHRRLCMGWSIREASDEACIPADAYYRIEKYGLRHAYVPVVYFIAAALETSPEWLKTGEGEETDAVQKVAV